MGGVTVGKAAQLAGVSCKAIRLWEAKGLLPAAERTEAGYRLFDEADVELLCFIRRARALGLSLEEITNVLELQRDGPQPCGRVTQLLDGHIEQIDHTLTDLRELRRALRSAHRTAVQTHRAGGDTVTFRITNPESGG
ncbi:MerR family transcriptional regulator [Streptomyces lavendulocolor]|uniref:MerR family transcriptional regulator n=1 Tax=Streptomyces lavendulocolor TaxID=67316 RepID=UPI0033CA320B